MKVVISQPFYLPWPGLFDQLRLADLFIHYDDVQLPQGRSFCTRVQLQEKQGISWLSVPIIGQSRGLIYETQIDNSQRWQVRHLNKIKNVFGREPYYSDVENLIADVLTQTLPSSLTELNISLVEHISKYLGLSTSFLRASELGVISKSSEKLLKLCLLNKATHYITGHGAKNYLNHELFEDNEIEVQYMHYQILPYEPLFGNFTPYMTILALIARKGVNAIHHLQSTTVSWRAFINE